MLCALLLVLGGCTPTALLPGVPVQPDQSATLVIRGISVLERFDRHEFAAPIRPGGLGHRWPIPIGHHTVTIRPEGEARSVTIKFDAKHGHEYAIYYDVDEDGRAPYVLDTETDQRVGRVIARPHDAALVEEEPEPSTSPSVSSGAAAPEPSGWYPHATQPGPSSLFTAGYWVFGLTYAVSAPTAKVPGDLTALPMVIPVIGPFVTMGTLELSNETAQTVHPLLALSGLAQVAGLTMFITGAAVGSDAAVEGGNAVPTKRYSDGMTLAGGVLTALGCVGGVVSVALLATADPRDENLQIGAVALPSSGVLLAIGIPLIAVGDRGVRASPGGAGVPRPPVLRLGPTGVALSGDF